MDKNETAAYYNQTIGQYRTFWRLDHHKAVHYGLWFKETITLQEALLNTNRELARAASLKAGQQLLDAGCGVGGTAIYLARETAVHVHGISLSEEQIVLARRYAEKEGVKELVKFSVEDYEYTSFPDASFDIVYGIESICHSNAKDVFLKEAYRLLKPGGKLLLYDFFEREEETGKEEGQMLLDWLQRWAVTKLAKMSTFKQQAEASGFDITEVSDMTLHIVPSARQLYLAYIPARIYSAVYSLIYPKKNHYAATHYRGLYWQYKSLRAGLWKYYFFMARKSAP